MKTTGICFALLIALLSAANAQEQKQIVDLRGSWKFETSDNGKYADPKYDDSKWGDIFAPAAWEKEGHPGYDGYAWYRKRFSLPLSAQGKELFFNGGFIDDACEIFINGHQIGGKGQMPPHFESAYDQEEIFVMPEEYLKFDSDNIVAIRVFDNYKEGGITRGKIGVFTHPDEIRSAVKLPDLWKFKTGDEPQWADPMMDDSKWGKVIVPSAWEYQGYEDYDGFAWYRVDVTIPASLQNESLFLVLGKIDDVDEAYFNGAKIGSTGRMGGMHW
jgi:beta-galactosidase/beta-glucuronidase